MNREGPSRFRWEGPVLFRLALRRVSYLDLAHLTESWPHKTLTEGLELVSSPTFGGGLLWDFLAGDSKVI